MILSPLQIFEVMRQAGFPPTVAVTMTAIALRESAGNPDAWNQDAKTGDLSFGLLQINMFGGLASGRMALFGITNQAQLFTPAVNARAGFMLWDGKNSNLDLAWYIGGDHAGTYRVRYEQHLPAAQEAALQSALGV